MRVGEPFNPYRLFHGLFIPDGVWNLGTISSSAKLMYGRLIRYAGESGRCYPKIATLMTEFKASERTIQNWLEELVTEQLIRRVQTNPRLPCDVVFLMHQCFLTTGEESCTPPPQDSAPLPRSIVHPSPAESCTQQESHTKESHSRESEEESTTITEDIADKAKQGFAAEKSKLAKLGIIGWEKEQKAEVPAVPGQTVYESVANVCRPREKLMKEITRVRVVEGVKRDVLHPLEEWSSKDFHRYFRMRYAEVMPMLSPPTDSPEALSKVNMLIQKFNGNHGAVINYIDAVAANWAAWSAKLGITGGFSVGVLLGYRESLVRLCQGGAETFSRKDRYQGA